MMKGIKRVPGGFRIGRFEFYLISGRSRKWFELDVCPSGCKMYSVGRLGFTILAGDCL